MKTVHDNNDMSETTPEEDRLALIARRHPAYPKQAASVIRSAKLIGKRIQDSANNTLHASGLSHPEFTVLLMLYGSQDYTLTPSVLGEAAGEKLANITRLTDHLSAKGLIMRKPAEDDRRKVAITMTPEGIHLIEQLLPAVSKDIRALTAKLSEEELAQLAYLQKKLLSQEPPGDSEAN